MSSLWDLTLHALDKAEELVLGLEIRVDKILGCRTNLADSILEFLAGFSRCGFIVEHSAESLIGHPIARIRMVRSSLHFVSL